MNVRKDETTEIQPGDPTPEEIAAACLEIQERGFTDRDGNRFPPWTDGTRRARRLHVPGEAWCRAQDEEDAVEVLIISLADVSAAAWDRAA